MRQAAPPIIGFDRHSRAVIGKNRPGCVTASELGCHFAARIPNRYISARRRPWRYRLTCRSYHSRLSARICGVAWFQVGSVLSARSALICVANVVVSPAASAPSATIRRASRTDSAVKVGYTDPALKVVAVVLTTGSRCPVIGSGTRVLSHVLLLALPNTYASPSRISVRSFTQVPKSPPIVVALYANVSFQSGPRVDTASACAIAACASATAPPSLARPPLVMLAGASGTGPIMSQIARACFARARNAYNASRHGRTAALPAVLSESAYWIPRSRYTIAVSYTCRMSAGAIAGAGAPTSEKAHRSNKSAIVTYVSAPYRYARGYRTGSTFVAANRPAARCSFMIVMASSANHRAWPRVGNAASVNSLNGSEKLPKSRARQASRDPTQSSSSEAVASTSVIALIPRLTLECTPLSSAAALRGL